MTTRTLERFAVGLVGAEGLALLVVAGWEIVALIAGDTVDATSSIALIVLTVVGAAAVLAFAAGIFRGQSWGRSGGVVTQLLMLAVAIGALTGPAPAPAFALTLTVPAVVGLALLFAVARRAARSAAEK